MEFKSPQCPYTVSVRRNPPRKAKATPATKVPDCTTSSTTSFVTNDIPRFPLEEIIQCEVSQNPPPLSKSSTEEENSENLRVFLRIRPLNTKRTLKKNGDGAYIARSRLKGISSKQDTKKKTKANEICLSVTDSRSVTLSPPQIMQDSKRVKTEVYDGFSHVFEPDSHQKEVYEKVMDPLVSDFIEGKSGMLAAMGPTGSGKTHTVFGCPREPGMVPLALRKIFNCTDGNGSSELSRSYYISMFEIYSERGKGERILDLSPDGADLCLQQSTIKGLQEVMVSNVASAEALIARGMFKRATAMTNSNSQSSRSQCIINIRGAPKMIGGQVEVLPSNAVLTIVDLAGAEREKKTGNQGTRLLESNFINNTSMVFGLCLRSLLEHQKNPKKSFQKHFQNSLLTRYLRDYLEGKKRMTLILTVKPGGDDYLDTSFLLRQASPYMKIKFNSVEEPSHLPYQKRCTNTLPRVEQPKRRKLCDLDTSANDEGKSARDEHPTLEKEVILETEHLKEEYCIELARMKRNEQVTQHFSKALWNVLKQYKKKLEESENEVQSLQKSLKEEKTRFLELEKELKDLKSCYSCCTQHSTKASSSHQVGTDAEFDATGSQQLTIHESNSIDEVFVDSCSPNLKASKCNLENCDATEESQKNSFQLENSDIVVDNSSLLIKDIKQQNYQSISQNSKCFPEKENDAKDLKELQYIQVKDNSSNADIAETCLRHSESTIGSSQSQSLVGGDDCSLVEQSTLLSEERLSGSWVSHNDEGGCVDACNVRKVLKTEPKHISPCKALNVEKPRRRLLPASSILLKEINGLDLEDENEKPKGNRRGERKFAAEERGRTQGSISLLRLLKSNLHL